MHRKLYINGRFLCQPLSGVQRFATEITMALARICPESVPLQPMLLVPPTMNETAPAISALTVGHSSGQIWEQLELPWHASDGILVNLGNTGPIIAGSQIIVVHDAGVFSSPDAYSWRFRLWYKLLQKAHVLRGTSFVTVSEFSKRELARHLALPEDSIRVVPEGADHMHRLSEDHSILHQHGLIPGRFVVAVGNLAAHKNLSALGTTAQMLAARGMTLAVTGGLDHGVFRSGTTLPRPATYVGRVSDSQLKALYRSAACFVFPSLYEGFGLPAIEAMACGCPVIAANIPSLREVCGTAALYAEPSKPDDIAAQIALVIDTGSLREEMRERAFRHAQPFTWNAAASALAAIADKLPRRETNLQLSHKLISTRRVDTLYPDSLSGTHGPITQPDGHEAQGCSTSWFQA